MSFSASLNLSVQAFDSAIVKPAALADSNAPFQPPRFVLPDLLSIIDSAFEYATSPHQNAAEAAGRTWLLQFKAAPEAMLNKFLEKGNFGRLAAMSFASADEEHFTTAYKYFGRFLSVDDAWDEGGIDDSYTTEQVEQEVYACWEVLDAADPATAQPSHPFAIMLQSIVVDMAKTATSGCRRRFSQKFKDWCVEVIAQCRRRSHSSLPSVEEYIDIRRKAVGQGAVEAIIEYAVQADLPDSVFEHPTVIAMSETATDILTWPNDIMSFNKEQAEGDYQNFVCVLMRERGLSLQSAVDTLTNMIASGVGEYIQLRAALPSFGAEVDAHLRRYLAEVEHEAYGAVRWCYESKRYWRKDVELHRDLIVELFPPKA